MIGKEANLTSPEGQRIKHRIYPSDTGVLIKGRMVVKGPGY